MNLFKQTGLILAAALMVAVAASPLSAQETGGGWVLLDARSTAIVRAGTEAMYNLRYSEADSIFRQLIADKPDHPAGYFLLALVDWWRIVPNSSVQSRVDRFSGSFNQRIDKVIEICDVRLDNNPNDIIGLFFKGSALGYRSRLAVLRNFSAGSLLDWVTAASEGREAYEIILRCQRLAPSNSDILLGSGLYNYLGAYIPQKYPIAEGALGFLPPGDKKIGISMLRIAAQRAQYAATEAKYSLLEILSLWEEDHAAALQVAKELFAQYPNNPVFHRFLAKSYYMTSDLLRADTLYVDMLRRVEKRASGYELSTARQGIYYLADIRLRRGMYDDAIRFFGQAAQLSRRFGEEDGGWIILAALKSGYAYDMLGKRREAIDQYEKVLDLDDYSTNQGSAHDLARKYISAPYAVK